ncbi:GGDEF domain-containing protein [Massilia niabensis]|uniref:diguanylate cyclase n=1 Tax=Massilia niabensis TaxID=544910 RepID=A0ABW0L8H6_9BURK
MDIHPLTGEFLRASKETSFLEHKQEQTRALLGFTLTFCTVFYLGFFATDVAALGWGPAALSLLGARVLVALTAGTCAWLAWRRPLSVRATRLVATIAESVALGCFMFITVQRPAEFHWHAMSLAIMLVVVYLYIPNRLSYASAIAMLATAGFVPLAAQHSAMSFADTLTMGMLLVLVNTFGFLAARRYNRVAREEFRSHAVLKYAAERDHLTGCFNRRYLHYQLMGEPGQEGAKPWLTIILCDIDRFKQINDTHGHGDGDIVLRGFAHMLQAATREPLESVVRYGGEEFLLVLPGTDLGDGVRLAERLRQTFAATELVASDGVPRLRATASFGVASVHLAQAGFTDPMRDAIAAADDLMYQAKRNGRDRVEYLQLGALAQAS